MKVWKMAALLGVSLFALGSAQAWEHIFSTGKLLDVSTEEHADAKHPQTHALYTVQADGMIYTVRGGKVKVHSKDYAKGLIIGDPVQVSVEGEHVYLQTPQGKELKTDIIKRARAQGY
jgi:hypothetical protein